MLDYTIEIYRKFKKDKKFNSKAEIWAEINDICKGITTNKRIWWEDETGIYHDGTLELPVELREIVDNAWIEKSRKW